MPAAIPLAAAAVGAAGSMMASKSAAKGQAAAAAAANSPWSEAQPYIIKGFEEAAPALDNALDMGVYDGQRVAGLNPYQTTGATQAGDFATGRGQAITDAMFNGGMSMGQSGLGFGSNAQSVFDRASQDPTQGFLETASQYANNPYVDGLIDANSRDITRNLNENQLPSLALGAAGSGNTNSTRTGVSEAIMQRGAADRLADVSNNIRSSFFNKGLDLAQSQYNTNMGRMLDANQQVGNAFQMGQSALTGAQQANGNNFDQSQAAGGVFQGNEQANIDADMRKFAEEQNIPLDLLGKYMSVINGKFGGQAISNVGPSTGASALQGGLGGALAGAGLYGKLGGFDSSPVDLSGSFGGSNSGFNFSGGGAGAPVVTQGGVGDYSFGMGGSFS